MTISLALIGCGGHALHHAENLGEHFTILTAWDPDPKFTEQIGTRPNVISLDELLASEAEAVLIGSPDEFHLEQIEAALNAGKHVFCEKPLLVPGQSIEELEAAFALAEEKGLVLTSCHPRRCDRPMETLHNYLTPAGKGMYHRRFGAVVSFSFDFSYHKPVNAWKYSRSLLLDHASHEIDLMNYLFGMSGFEAWKLCDGPDSYALVGRRDDGVTFSFKGTRRLDAKNYPEWCSVRFERGEVVVDMMTGTMHLIDHEGGTRAITKALDFSIDYDRRLKLVMARFALQIETGMHAYLTRSEMLMNSEVGILLQNDGVQRVNIRS